MSVFQPLSETSLNFASQHFSLTDILGISQGQLEEAVYTEQENLACSKNLNLTSSVQHMRLVHMSFFSNTYEHFY